MSNLNIFKLKKKAELVGDFTMEREIDGVATEVPFKLVELSYSEALTVGSVYNKVGYACLYGMRNLDGSPVFSSIEELESFTFDLVEVHNAILKLSEKAVQPEQADQVELEKK